MGLRTRGRCGATQGVQNPDPAHAEGTSRTQTRPMQRGEAGLSAAGRALARCCPHSPGETARGCWRAGSCQAAAAGSPPLTWLEKTTHMDVIGWKGSKWKHRPCKASDHLLSPSLSLPTLLPREAEEIPKPLLSSTEGLGAACCAMPHPPARPLAATNTTLAACAGSHRKQ